MKTIYVALTTNNYTVAVDNTVIFVSPSSDAAMDFAEVLADLYADHGAYADRGNEPRIKYVGF